MKTRATPELLNYILDKIRQIPLWVVPLVISIFLFLPTKELVIPPDGAEYMSNALNIYKGYGFLDTSWAPLYQRPALPALMAVSFWLFGEPSVVSAFLTTRLFFSLIALLIYFLGEKLYNRWVGLVASLLALSSVSLNEWATYIHLDHIMPFFMLLFLLLTFMAFEQRRYHWFILAGLVLGFGYLVKEVSLIFIPVPIMTLVAVKMFRSRTNLIGTFLLLIILALIILLWTGYVNSHTTDLRPTVTGGTVTLVQNKFASYDANVESLTLWRYLRAFITYYERYLKPNFDLAPLMVIAWGFTFVVAIVKRDKASLFVSCAVLPLVTIIIFQGTVGYRQRQGVVLFLLSYLILANFIVQVSFYLRQRLIDWLKQPKYNWLTTGTVVLIISTPIIFQVGFEVVLEGTMLKFIERYNTIQFLFREKYDLEQQGGRGEDLDIPKQAGQWVVEHVPPGSKILSTPYLLKSIYFSSKGEYPIFELFFPPDSWHLRQTELAAMQTKNATPLFLWPSGTGTTAQDRLYILTEEYLLQELETKSIDYVIVTPKENFLVLYFLDNPGFQKVTDFGNGTIQIFEVNDPDPVSFEAHMSPEVPAFLEIIQRNNPERYQWITENFFKGHLGWDSNGTQEILSRQLLTIRPWQPVRIDDYVKLCQSKGSHEVNNCIAQHQQAVELHSNNPWPYLILGKLYQEAQGNIEKALAIYDQVFAANPDNPQVRLSLAKAYIAKGKIMAENEAYAEANYAFRQAFVIASNNPELSDSMLQVYLLLEGYPFEPELLSEMITSYQKAVELEPDNIQVYLKLAGVYKILEREDEATVVYAHIVDRWPDLAEAHLRLGEAYEIQGELEPAIAEYKRAIELEPTLAEAYRLLGNLYQVQNRINEAITLYQTASKNNPEIAWPHIWLGQLYLEQANLQ